MSRRWGAGILPVIEWTLPAFVLATGDALAAETVLTGDAAWAGLNARVELL